MIHLFDDPYLKPYADALRGFSRRTESTVKRLTGGRQSLVDWANAHEYFGWHREGRRFVFREWAPNATAMWLVGDFNGWRRNPDCELVRIGHGGVWECKLPASRLRHGQRYHLEVCWEGGSGERIPAYARRVVQDETTKLFEAQVWLPRTPYRWRNRGRLARPRRNWTPLIYEAHVGMGTEAEKVGSYVEFRDQVLPRIVRAGYNTVQLMAVMEHPYYGSFGYHVSSFFAASSRFGTPEELKSLVDAAHGLGLRVIIDLVHSHAVANERDGLSRFDGTEYQYFHSGGRGHHPAWDSRCFDYGKTEVLHFLLSNCKYWLEEFDLDGYRFDGVTSMLYLDHGLGRDFTGYGDYFDGSADCDAWTYLNLANRVIHAVRPAAITIAEDVSGMPGVAASARDGGIGFDYRMAMGEPDFWFRLAEKVRDEDWPMGGIYHQLTDRRPEEKVVSYVESHDQALVGGKTFFFQLVDKEVYWGMDVGRDNLVVERGLALHKMCRLGTLALNGGAYLNFMGNEFGHPEWIDFPRAENGWSYRHARRQWSLRDDAALRFKGLGDFDAAAMAALGKGGSCFRADPVRLVADEGDKVLAFVRGGFLFVFNFHASASYENYGVLVPPATSWRHALDSDEVRFGGQGRIERGRTYAPHLVRARGEIVQQVSLYLPARTAIVFRRGAKVIA